MARGGGRRRAGVLCWAEEEGSAGGWPGEAGPAWRKRKCRLGCGLEEERKRGRGGKQAQLGKEKEKGREKKGNFAGNFGELSETLRQLQRGVQGEHDLTKVSGARARRHAKERAVLAQKTEEGS